MANQKQQPGFPKKIELDSEDLPISIPEDDEKLELGADSAEDNEASLLLEEDEPPEELPKKRSKLLIFGAAGVILILILGAVWWFFLRSEPKKIPEPTPEPQAAAQQKPQYGPPRITMEPFLIPLQAGPQGRLLRAMVVLEFNNTQERDSVTDVELLVIADTIYRSMRYRTPAELYSARLSNRLHTQLKEQINVALGKELVKQVYFPEFLFAG